jgi:hypothetical protein
MRIVVDLAQKVLENFACFRRKGTNAVTGGCSKSAGETSRVIQLNDEGSHDACFHV